MKINNFLNRGLKYERTKSNIREKTFADLWEEENQCKTHVNYGMGIAQDLMVMPKKMQPKISLSFYGQDVFVKYKLTKRERIILATVIQWLGSNIGFCFLETALKNCGYRIVKEDK
jgi:hypothetical protein